MPEHAHHLRSRHIIRTFYKRALKKRSLAVRVADRLTQSFGSPLFLVLNLVLFIAWILINTGFHPGITPFDPYPFVMLITLVSIEAIILTVTVLISQNRAHQLDAIREELELQVELITERETTKIISLLKRLLEKLGDKMDDPELEDMLKEVDTPYIERQLEEQIGK
jgi:uncharacterized membrane protein